MPAKPDSEVLYGFGERIRTLRKRAGLSQAELANEIKVTKQAISWWEQGFTPNCSALALYRASQVLDTTMEYLIAGNTFHSIVPAGFRVVCDNTMDQATARDEMPETMEELADADPSCHKCGTFYSLPLTECPWCGDSDAEEIESMSEDDMDKVLLDAGCDPDGLVERTLKRIEVPHD